LGCYLSFYLAYKLFYRYKEDLFRTGLYVALNTAERLSVSGLFSQVLVDKGAVFLLEEGTRQ
jgi:hypothetical protein